MLQNEFQTQAMDFLTLLFAEMKSHGIAIQAGWDIDHLCYRVSSLDRYDALKKDFSTFGTLLVESEVNGRPIATFKLFDPITWGDANIDVVELPAPKPSKPTTEGFEHIEVVVDVPMKDLIERYAHLPLDRGGLKKDFNAELEITLGSRNLKFHHLSLESVVNLERHSQAFKALRTSEILRKFRKYDPLVAGTFPLGLNVADSDLDILMNATDLEALRTELQGEYGDLDFKSRITVVDGLESLIVHFVHENIPFEVFAQSAPSVQQKAYRHFQIEEKILKNRGPEFLKKIRDLRNQGLKTEPAFAKALGLTGDPYDAVLNFKF